jgi:hypothetical protein
MIIRDPRPEAAAIRGTVVDQFSEHVDVLPTILHWLGATDLPLQCDGHSLLPFLTAGEGAPSGWRTEAHWEYDWRDVTQSADAAAAEGGSPEEQMGLTMHQCGLMVSRCGGAERRGPSLLLVLHRFYPSLRVSRACLGKSFVVFSCNKRKQIEKETNVVCFSFFLYAPNHAFLCAGRSVGSTSTSQISLRSFMTSRPIHSSRKISRRTQPCNLYSWTVRCVCSPSA